MNFTTPIVGSMRSGTASPDFDTFDALHTGFERLERTGSASKGAAMDLMRRERGTATTPDALRDAALRAIARSHLSRHTKTRFAALARAHAQDVADALMGLFGPDAEPTEGALAAAVGRLAPLALRAGSGNPDTELVRTSLQSLLMFAHPEDWLDLNQERRKRVLAELYGEAAPDSADVEATAACDRRIARDLLEALSGRGLAPRDTIDVHGFLWTALREWNASRPITEELIVTQRALNTILYGPAGTGKTHATRARAVAICDGWDPDGVLEDPDALRGALRGAGPPQAHRVRHLPPVYGYEEFVEGLRPDPGGHDEAGEPSAGLRLRAVDGALKRIADRAASSRASTGAQFDLSVRGDLQDELGRERRRGARPCGPSAWPRAPSA